ncbi:MAG: PASTA domain-containing protein [Fibrobacter sp.]|nr:PASTA domain-containing protein [Fibrobacter sp.]
MKILNASALSIFKMFVLGVVGVLAFQTFTIQVLNREVYQQETKNIATRTKNIYAERGQIMDRNGVVFADNLRESRNAKDFTRIFLQGKLASQIVGKVGYNGVGSMGVEQVFDDRLRGNEGFRVSVTDSKQREVFGRSEDVAAAKPGKNLVLTIDKNMQEIVENALKDGVEEFQALSASAVVVDPHTGEILAMASYPTFDPNSKAQVVGRMSKNDIVSLTYEPGSTFKIVTAATALESGMVDTNRVFPFEKTSRCWKFSDKSKEICDSHFHGDMNMPQAMEESSNIVFAKIADEVGAQKLYSMANHFGFGIKTTEIFNGEGKGKLYQPYELTRDERTLKTMGFGHAVLATPIQIAMAYSAIANGGLLMQPQIVKEWRDSQGNLVEKSKPDTVRRVVSEKTAASIRHMLSRVVNGEHGTAKQVRSNKIPDMIFGGKTGTAEKYNKEIHAYDRELQIASFIGLAPVEDTRYVGLVLVDEPHTAQKHGGNTAGPIFRRIMEGIYYHPELSPVSHRMAVVEKKSSCDDDYVGMMLADARQLAKSKNCKVNFVGKEAENSRVISMRRDVFDSLGTTLVIGPVEANKMPDLKGLSLKDALEVAGNVRMKVEYSGKGRVVAQFPKADEVLRKGQVCKLTLKERG